MSRSTRKPTLGTLRNVSTRISLSMPRRLTRTDTFRSCGFSVSEIITLYLSIHYAESIMLVLSWNVSYIYSRIEFRMNPR